MARSAAEIAAAGGGEEGPGDAVALGALDRVARAGGRTCLRARTASWRTAAASRSSVAATSSSADVEHVVQQEGRALQRRQALQGQHQRQRQLVGPRLSSSGSTIGSGSQLPT